MTPSVPLDELRGVLTRHVVMPSPEATDAVTLWIAATHAQPAWHTAPRLFVSSPVKRCGKSRLLDVVEACSHAPLMAFNATPAAIVRSIDADDPPTLIFDEADTIWPVAGSGGSGAENLRALLNAGFNRGRPVIRCVGVGSNQAVVRLPSFAMAALAGIGTTVPDTVLDRSVIVTMRRRAPDENVAPLRASDLPALHDVGRQVGAWMGTNLTNLANARPNSPVTDRAADVWSPLLATADLAGGSWPPAARKACETLCEAYSATEDASGPVAVLSAIRSAFDGQPRLTTAEILTATSSHGVPDGSSLATTLRPYGISSRNLKLPTGAVLKGYRREDFTDTFARYLP